ncbi:HAMP domain-containing histidine kinase [Neolewinella aurantiaca]|uniref:histidine kinase n=1 Tax=Neolewinella aurantiaca TaxID=2602767 RepID=A0A5C7FLB1_9BACT|nr:HAMP domain-containing sensor histidine kinase [Neolewinella aurantiaca]TXF88158.1 HAMP domain-containing histidine kinase [Neolewinella aurantiaca]
MKLLNQSLLYLFVPLFVIVSVWAVVFYVNMLDEVYDSIDDGLDNSKLLIIRKSAEDSTVLSRREFAEGNYSIREIGQRNALARKDLYQDTLMYMLNEEEMEPVRLLTTAFERGGKYYELKVINSMVEEDDQIANLLWSVLWLYLLLLGSIALINNLALKKLWQPFYDYLEQLKRYRIDRDEEMNPIETDTKEFLELKKSADILILHSREAYRNQKQFNENAAHELQTPLAVITNKLELLLEDSRLMPENAAVVSQVMDTTARLIQLNRSLLLLSKIENKQFFDNHPVSINQVMRRVEDELEELFLYRNIEISFEEAEEVVANMDAHLAYVLVANLIRNAIFHNIEGGTVRVAFGDRSMTVNNTSSTGELNGSMVFKRFYKADGARKSTGLGLAIVHAICDLYGYKVSYSYEDSHSFRVDF